MRTLKRTYHVTPADAQQITKRLRMVERSTRLNRPEMKHKTFSITGTITAGTVNVGALTDIAQGDTIAERSGDRIRVWRVEIRGMAEGGVDNHLLQQHNTSLPTIADYTSAEGSMLLDSSTNTRFTEWKYFKGYWNGPSSGSVIRVTQKFRNGMVVKYGGTASTPVDNGLLITQVNRSGVDHEVNYTIRIYFTDA